MDPITPMLQNQPFSMNVFVPNIFPSAADRENYLSALDSDTRAYLTEHADEFTSMDDIIKYVDSRRSDV